jgi:hypothetical protein
MIEPSKAPLPPILYKYCPPERIDIISKQQIRFSPPSDFNDAFDSWLPAPEIRTNAGQRRAKLDRAKQRSQLGILCLTEEADNHLMWVNYARDHTGFVIGFGTSSPFFQVGGSGLRQVKYEPPPSDSPKEDSYIYKSKDWKYECEWRHVREFDDSDDRHRLVAIDDDLIVEIIFGHDMKNGDVSEIVSWVECLTKTSPSKRPVAFFQSTPDYSTTKFVKKPRSVECCKHCQGLGYRMEDKAPDE